MSDYPGFDFEILAEADGTRARVGRLTTPHGGVDTPAFLFCATKAAIKGLSPQQMRDCGADIILANTYHLMLQPGADLVAGLGGLHAFMGWDGPLLTDSGGFQIFSLGHGSVADEIKGSRPRGREPLLIGVGEDGAEFRSYLDGSRHLLTPESSIDIQRRLGADLVLVLDECTPYHADRDYTARSMELSHRWAERGLAEFARGADGRQALFGIVQGGVHEDLRRASAEFVRAQPFFGQAIGGSLGADKAEMLGVVAMATPHLDPGRPVHLLGIGGVHDIWEAVALGVDSFDCVAPTRLARHGHALARGADGDRINLRNAAFREDMQPLDETCPCACCRGFARAYLHHLLKAGELLAIQLLALHNVTFMTRLMAEIRDAILAGRFAEAKRVWLGA